MNICCIQLYPCLVSTIIFVLLPYAYLLNSFDELHNNITILYFNNTEQPILLLFSRLILSFDENNKKYFY